MFEEGTKLLLMSKQDLVNNAYILFSNMSVYLLKKMEITGKYVAPYSIWQKLNMRALPLNCSPVNKDRAKVNFPNSDLNFDDII
mmetsp:Transcript_12693/g.27358  ORF Transcript_12693/g.27358 Transcript_12693/m.27358 type:complete len:84 (-) Transcript_12693:471-722(-)